MKMFEPATIAAVEAMYLKAQAKHPGYTLNEPSLHWGWKLSALAEEFGEVAQLFTYDKRDEYDDDWRQSVVKELLQTAALCLAWTESIDHKGN